MRFKFNSKPLPVTEYRKHWQKWQAFPVAEQLATIEQQIVDPLIAKKFGQHLLQISMAGSPPLHQKSFIENKTLLEFEYPVVGSERTIISRPDDLSIGNETIDCLILHHVLEFSEDPHKILRESLRVLVSGGQLFILGFNPYSFWGLRKLLTVRNEAPWSGTYYSQYRLADWLRLLDLKLEKTRFGFFNLPIKQGTFPGRFKQVEAIGRNYNCFFGGVYVMVARKQVGGLIPLQKRWAGPRIMSFPVSEPTTRNLAKTE
jgi:SAM-dependent methyltransferase